MTTENTLQNNMYFTTENNRSIREALNTTLINKTIRERGNQVKYVCNDETNEITFKEGSFGRATLFMDEKIIDLSIDGSLEWVTLYTDPVGYRTFGFYAKDPSRYGFVSFINYTMSGYEFETKCPNFSSLPSKGIRFLYENDSWSIYDRDTLLGKVSPEDFPKTSVNTNKLIPTIGFKVNSTSELPYSIKVKGYKKSTDTLLELGRSSFERNYRRTDWIPFQTLVSADNLNKMETQISYLVDRSFAFASAVEKISVDVNDHMKSTNLHLTEEERKALNETISKGIVTSDEFSTHRSERASLTQRGHVQLSDLTNSTSTTLAATPSAVKKAYDIANSASQSASTAKSKVDSLSSEFEQHKITNASLSASGHVQLSSDINSTSTSLAATPAAVKQAYDLANTVSQTVKSLSTDYEQHKTQKASLTNTGHTQLSNSINSTSTTLAATPSAVKQAYDLANTASQTANSNSAILKSVESSVASLSSNMDALSSKHDQHKAEKASLSAAGHVQLSSAINSTSTTLAATPAAVKQAYDLAQQAFQSASDGKSKIAKAITGKGISTSTSDTWDKMATNIGNIVTGDYSIGDIIPNDKLQDTPELAWSYTQHNNIVYDVAVDTDGNTYSGGSEGVLHKTDSDGTTIWRIPFQKSIQKVSVDLYGYVYVGCNENGIWKINTDTFNTEWTYSGHGAVNNCGVEVDTSGNVYTAGYDNTIRKLNSNGSLVWKYSCTDFPYDLRIDSEGNVYAAKNVMYILKLNNSGSVQWKKSIDKNGVIDLINNMAVDKRGNVYAVTFGSRLCKFDRNGNLLYQKSLASRPNAITVDENDNLYISYSYTTYKFDNNLNLIWSIKTHTSTVYEIVLGTRRDVYTCGGDDKICKVVLNQKIIK